MHATIMQHMEMNSLLQMNYSRKAAYATLLVVTLLQLFHQ